MSTIPERCVFCRIVAGEVRAHVVYEDAGAVAFLDHRPLFPGHTLLVPREHHKTLPDLPLDAVDAYFRVARMLTSAIRDALDAEGTFVAINNGVSQSVPHLHVHVVPRTRGDGLRGFFWPRRDYEDDAHAASTAEAIRRAVADLEPPCED